MERQTEHTVFDSTTHQEQETAITELSRQLGRYRMAMFLLVLILIFSLMGNAYFYYYMTQLDQSGARKVQMKQPDNGLIPGEVEEASMVGSLVTPAPTVTNSVTLESFATETKEFISDAYKFSFEYPASWQMRNDSGQFRMFDNGDIFTVSEMGSQQQPQTELYDGVVFSVMKPVESDKEIRRWMEENYNIPREGVELSRTKIGEIQYEVARACGLSCIDYYHFKKENRIYGFGVISVGPNKEKYDASVKQVIESFRFTE
jgi:hypothetical protein